MPDPRPKPTAQKDHHRYRRFADCFQHSWMSNARWRKVLTAIAAAARRLACCLTALLLLPACDTARTAAPSKAEPRWLVAYRNDFQGPVSSTFPEWSSSPLVVVKTVTGRTESLPAPLVASVQSPNRRQRFLGEFGGPPIGRLGDPDWNRTRVEQTVRLSLENLRPHTRVRLAFDLYVLKSWDGNSPRYGPDRFTLRIAGGPTLCDTTFSNNPKVAQDASDQSFPATTQPAHNPPRTGAASTGILGYSDFFTDSVYPLSFTFAHDRPTLTIEFTSSLFEGKGPADESWGLDNVIVRTAE